MASMTPQAPIQERPSVGAPPHTKPVASGGKQGAYELTCWRVGPDCRGQVWLRWLDAEHWESLPACERHYAEWRREELAIDAAIDAALDEEGGAAPEVPSLPEARAPALPEAPEAPAQSREPGDQAALAGVQVDNAASHADDGVSFWYSRAM